MFTLESLYVFFGPTSLFPSSLLFGPCFHYDKLSVEIEKCCRRTSKKLLKYFLYVAIKREESGH